MYIKRNEKNNVVFNRVKKALPSTVPDKLLRRYGAGASLLTGQAGITGPRYASVYTTLYLSALPVYTVATTGRLLRQAGDRQAPDKSQPRYTSLLGRRGKQDGSYFTLCNALSLNQFCIF